MMRLENVKEVAEAAIDESEVLRKQNAQLLKHSRKLLDDMRERALNQLAAND